VLALIAPSHGFVTWIGLTWGEKGLTIRRGMRAALRCGMSRLGLRRTCGASVVLVVSTVLSLIAIRPAAASAPALAAVEVVSSTHLTPDAARYVVNVPGTVVQTTYTATASDGSPLPGTTLNLTVNHGFFTPLCNGGSAGGSYDACSLRSSEAGDLSSLGSATAVKTDGTGKFTVATSVARDPGLDNLGELPATMTASSPDGSVTARAVPWTTDALPLNGGDVSIHGISISIRAGEQNVAYADRNLLFSPRLTDQFGNLASWGGTPQTALQAQNDGTVSRCTDPRASDGCGGTDQQLTQWPGSYLLLRRPDGTPAQTRFAAFFSSKVVDQCGNVRSTAGKQRISASAAAPRTVRDGNGGWTESTAQISTTVDVTYSFLGPGRPDMTVGTTPANTVPVGRTVTESVLVLDPYGAPATGLTATFTRTSSPGSDCADGPTTVTTDAQGRAHTSFTCRTPGSSTFVIVVTNCMGDEYSRATQTVVFTAPIRHVPSPPTTNPTPTPAPLPPAPAQNSVHKPEAVGVGSLPSTGAPLSGLTSLALLLVTLGCALVRLSGHKRIPSGI
jgi:hypothetical protein